MSREFDVKMCVCGAVSREFDVEVWFMVQCPENLMLKCGSVVQCPESLMLKCGLWCSVQRGGLAINPDCWGGQSGERSPQNQ